MNRIGIIFMLTAVIFFGCSSTTGGETETSAQEVALAAGDEQEKGTAKPIHLDKEMFMEKVMNFEKNPKAWVFEGDKPCIVDFYADWCRPCKMIAPIMEELAEEYEGQIDIYKVDTQTQRELASLFGITSIPALLFVPMEGNPSMQKGAMPKETFVQIIDEFLLTDNKTETTKE